MPEHVSKSSLTNRRRKPYNLRIGVADSQPVDGMDIEHGNTYVLIDNLNQDLLEVNDKVNEKSGCKTTSVHLLQTFFRLTRRFARDEDHPTM